MELTNKTILIISPERWGVNFLSKHHYARVLAKKNNRVFFLNPPSVRNKGTTLHPTGIPNLTVVDYRGIPGLNNVVKVGFLFKFLMKLNVRALLKHLPAPDVVWSFDPYRFQDLRLFEAKLCIFHPVDYYRTNLDLLCARSADIIFSVAQEILDRYKQIQPFSFFINHGVSDEFLEALPVPGHDGRVRCGYVGNLLSAFIDHKILLRIVQENPEVEFHFIGPGKANNLGSGDEPENPIHQVAAFANVILHGEMTSNEVATLMRQFDLFLICYDESLVPNNHKVLEYLSTGKVVVSSRVSTYDRLAGGLFEMAVKNDELPARFKSTIANLSLLNSEPLTSKRISFARDNSYENQLKRIGQHLDRLKI